MNVTGDQELIQRILAEAVHQLGGIMRVNVADLGEHRGKFIMGINDGVLTCSFQGQRGEA